MKSCGRGLAVEVQLGRYTADIDGDFVVFLIGMRLDTNTAAARCPLRLLPAMRALRRLGGLRR
jgi:hypothetical protein